ncbi:MAG: LptF/LptG family permease [Elusimicrobiota bacterium]
MKLITRYVTREFLKPLFFSIFAFGGLVMISEFFRELNFYLEKKANFIFVFQYLMFNFPWWTIQVLPISVLLAVLFSLGNLARHNEITAMKAAGVNVWRIFSVIFICGMLLSAGEIFLREKVIPNCVRQAERIRQEKIKQESQMIQTEFKNLVVSLPGNGRMTVNHLSAKTGLMSGIIIDYFDNAFHLKNQIVAPDAKWDGTKWIFGSGVERNFTGDNWNERRFSGKQLSLPFKPEDYIEIGVRPEQMTTPEFIAYIGQLDKLGKPTEKELIQFYLRYSSALSHIIVMLIGIPFALGLGSRFGKIVSFTFAVMFAFIYWGFQAIGQSLGQFGVISPILAAWLGNIIFGITGLALVSRVQK